MASHRAITVVGLRTAIAAAVLWLVARPSVREYSRRQWMNAILLGTVTVGMNLLFYCAIVRLPLGIAMTITFLGPFAVALLGSHKLTDMLWPVMALAGVVLFAPAIGHHALSTSGLLFSLAAATAWGIYLVLTARTSSMFPGATGLTLATTFGAVIALPVGLATAHPTSFEGALLLRGFIVAMLSTFIPFSLEFLALKRMSPRMFGILVSADPAVAALVGLAVLHESLSGREWLALVLVTVAAVGAMAQRKDQFPRIEI
ncbi:MAG TPA: EamA family transporter [Candidatus Angelobacter sp.]|nr:EamA family transporter [Candidatus Angelobacter sp.]